MEWWFIAIWAVGAVSIFLAPMIAGDEKTADNFGDELVTIILIAVFWPFVLVLGGLFFAVFGLCNGIEFLYRKGTYRMNRFWRERKIRNEAAKR